MGRLGQIAAISAFLLPWTFHPDAAGAEALRSPALESGIRFEIPVRVFRGNRFAGSLEPEDFEIRENGLPRNIESFARPKENGASPAAGQSTFLLCFEMSESPPGFEKAVDYFFENVPAEGDRVLVQTPRDRWEFTVGPGGRGERRKTAAGLKPLLLASLQRSREARPGQIETLRRLAASGEDEFMTRWRARDVLDELAKERAIDETKYQAFTDYFKAVPGRKHILVFYREDAVPIPALFADDWRMTVAARQKAFGLERVRAFFADAGLTFHLVVLDGEKRDSVDILSPDDASPLEGDFFQPYRDLASTTGGITAAASDPVAAMKLSAEAAENYYLLAFRSEAPRDGNFHEITIRVKKPGFEVFHRAGYVER